MYQETVHEEAHYYNRHLCLSKLHLADGLPEVLALDRGELELKLGWLAGAVSSSERACSPGRS